MYKAAAILSLALLLAACGLFDDDDSGNLDTNSPPTVELSASPASGPAPLEVTLTATASDAEGDTLSYNWSLEGLPDAAIVTTELTEVGEYPITVTVSDGENEVDATTTVTVTGDETDPTAPIDPTDPTDPSDPEPQIKVEATPGGPVPWAVRYDYSVEGYPEGSNVVFNCNAANTFGTESPVYIYDDDSIACVHLRDDEDIEITVTDSDTGRVLATERLETDLEPASEVPFGGTWRYTKDGNPPVTFDITQSDDVYEFGGTDATGETSIFYDTHDAAGYVFFESPIVDFLTLIIDPQPLEDGTQRYVTGSGFIEKID